MQGVKGRLDSIQRDKDRASKVRRPPWVLILARQACPSESRAARSGGEADSDDRG